MIDRCWIVCNANQIANTPKVFNTLEEAQKHASSLARSHFGNFIGVFEMVDCYQAIMPEAQRVEVV